MQLATALNRRLEFESLLRTVGLIALVFATAVFVPLFLFRNSASAFLPHLFCYLANPTLTWTHVTSDSVIGLSYLAISLTLLYIVYRSPVTVPFSWLVLAFGLFIVACGATHVMEVITVWKPLYWVSASIKVLTAGASLATAVALPVVTPMILTRLHAAETSEERRVQLQAANIELARLNRELKELDDLRASLMAQQAMRIGDWEWDIATGENRWSAAVEIMHGFRPGTYDGRYESWVATIHPEDRERVTSAVENALQTGSYELEYRTVRSDDSTYWSAARGMVICDDGGKPIRMLGICMDVTERKSREQALLRAEKLAAAGRLAAAVAHEINNPLEAITNLIYLARQQKDPKPFLDLLDTELSRVAAITRQTLGFYRDTSSPTDVDLKAVLGEVVEIYSSKLKTKKISVEIQAQVEPVVRARMGDLHQIFGNLLLNAIDASPHGGNIVLRLTRSGEHGIDVEVMDHGTGVAPNNQEVIFEPFYTTKKDVGTGLGLWVSRQLVERMGGKVSLHSNCQGVGTCFRVYLPESASNAVTA